MIEKPVLCDDCKAGSPRCFCSSWPMTCRDRLSYWLSGFIKGKDAGYQEGFDQALVSSETIAPPSETPTIPCGGEV